MNYTPIYIYMYKYGIFQVATMQWIKGTLVSEEASITKNVRYI